MKIHNKELAYTAFLFYIIYFLIATLTSNFFLLCLLPLFGLILIGILAGASDVKISYHSPPSNEYHHEDDDGEFYRMKHLEKQWEREKDEKQKREEQMFTKDDDSGHYWDS